NTSQEVQDVSDGVFTINAATSGGITTGSALVASGNGFDFSREEVADNIDAGDYLVDLAYTNNEGVNFGTEQSASISGLILQFLGTGVLSSVTTAPTFTDAAPWVSNSWDFSNGTGGAQISVGELWAVYTREGHYAIMEIIAIGASDFSFDYKYQPDGSTNFGAASPSVTILSPNGGEELTVGETYEITWTDNFAGSDLIEIRLSTNGGESFSILNDGQFSTYNGSYSWIVPDNIGTNNLIQIANTSQEVQDVSDGVFTINAAVPSLIVSVQDGPWSETTTWAGGVVPTSTDDVEIINAVVLDGDFTVKNLILSSGGSLNMGTTSLTLTVTGDFAKNSGSVFTAGNSTLILSGTDQNYSHVGDITYFDVEFNGTGTTTMDYFSNNIMFIENSIVVGSGATLSFTDTPEVLLNGTSTFNNAGSITGNNKWNLVIDGTSHDIAGGDFNNVSWQSTADLVLTSNFNFDGELSTPANGSTINLGDFIINTGRTFELSSDDNINFNLGGFQVDGEISFTTNGQTMPRIVVNVGGGNFFNINGGLIFGTDQSLVIESGSVDLNDRFYFEGSSGGIFVSGGQLSVRNATLEFASGATFSNSGGTVEIIGDANPETAFTPVLKGATTTDSWSFIQSGGILNIANSAISEIGTLGLTLTGGIVFLNNTVFSNGLGTSYLTFDSGFDGNTFTGITFGAGPTNNVSFINDPTQTITFDQYSGSLGGPDFANPGTNGSILWTNEVLTAPVDQASNILVSNLTENSATLSWENGGGSQRLVLVHEGVTSFPSVANNTTYVANPEFGLGDEASTGWHAVYAGSSNTADVFGLKLNTYYEVAVLEYNEASFSVFYNSSSVSGNPESFITANDYDVFENFEGGIPQTWILNNASGEDTPARGKNEIAGAAAITGGSDENYIETPFLENVTSFTFDYSTVEGGFAGAVFEVLTTTDEGVTFTSLGSRTLLTPGYTSFTHTFETRFSGNIRISSLSASDQTILVDDFGAYIQSDIIAPTFQTLATADIFDTSIDINFSLDEAGTVYFVAVGSGATPPSTSEVVDPTSYSGAIESSGNFGPNTSGTFTFSNLTASTNYDLYFVAEDALFNVSSAPDVLSNVSTTAPPIPEVTFTSLSVENDGNVYIENSNTVVYKFQMDVTINDVTTDIFQFTPAGTVDFTNNVDQFALYESLTDDGLESATLIGTSSINPEITGVADGNFGFQFANSYSAGESVFFYLTVDLNFSTGLGTDLSILAPADAGLTFVETNAIKDLTALQDGETFLVETCNNYVSPLPLKAVYSGASQNGSFGSFGTNSFITLERIAENQYTLSDYTASFWVAFGGQSSISATISDNCGTLSGTEDFASPFGASEITGITYNKNDGSIIIDWVQAFNNITEQTILTPLEVIPGVIESDSNALVSFYNELGGENWTINDNWSTEGQSIAFWYGVTIDPETSRVIGIDLSDNQLSGAVPEALLSLTALTSLNLTNNNITGLPDLTQLTTLGTAQFENNDLDFGDLEPLLGYSPLAYVPQNNLSEDEDIIYRSSGETITISLPPVEGTANTIEWLKDEIPIPSETGLTLSLNPTEDIEGVYSARITSSIITDLQLVSGSYVLLENSFNESFETLNSSFSINSPQDEDTETADGVLMTINLGDLNGDGIDELGILHSNKLGIYNGGAISQSPDTEILAATGVGYREVRSGDFNGDGFSDISLNTQNSNTESGSLEFYFGGVTFDTEVDHQISTVNFPALSLTIASHDNIGDVNNDGADDILILDRVPEAYIVFGGATISTEADIVLSDFSTVPASGNYTSNPFGFGFRSTVIEDLNGDGINDFAISDVSRNFSNGVSQAAGVVYVYLGNTSSTFNAPDFALNLSEVPSTSSTSHGFFGINLTSGDFNGDGFSDIAVMSFQNSDPNSTTGEGGEAVFVWEGATTFDNIVDQSIKLPAAPYNLTDITFLNSFLGQMLALQDYNENGADELLFGSFPNGGMSNAIITEGSSSFGENAFPSLVLSAPDPSLALGLSRNVTNVQRSVAFGDFDYDGTKEIVLPQLQVTGQPVHFFDLGITEDVIPPVITGLTEVNVSENETVVQTVTADEVVTWSISGVDESLFSIDDGGNLIFTNAPDFEVPVDADLNNVYELVITAIDGNSNNSDISVSITVTDIDEVSPQITGLTEVTISENETAVQTVTADEAVTWSISGVDESLFSIDEVGNLIFASAPDFENPLDENADNVYEVAVIAADASGNTSQLAIAVTITNINDIAPTIDSQDPVNLEENTLSGVEVISLNVTDGDTSDGFIWTITSGNSDVDRDDILPFAINETTGTIIVNDSGDLDFESGTTSFELLVTVNDGINDGSTAITINITDVIEDSISPTVIVSTDSPSPTNASSITVAIVFDEEVIFGVDSLTLNNATASNFSGSGAEYTVELTPIADGEFGVSVLPGKAQDLAGNPSLASNELILVSDKTAPTVTIVSDLGIVTNAAVVPISVTFSEPVTGFDELDLNLILADFIGISGEGSDYKVEISPQSEGDFSIQVVSNAATDLAGNGSEASETLGLESDVTGPSITVNSLSTESDSPEITGTVGEESAIVVLEVNGITYNTTNNGSEWVLAANTIESLPVGEYQMTATATDLIGNISSAIGILEVIGGPIQALAPSEIGFTSFRANWNSRAGATSYQFDLARDQDFDIILPDYNSLTITDNSLFIEGLDFSTSYYYRVRAVYDADIADNSNVIALKTNFDEATQNDSTALLEIYDALNGEEWTISNNWKAGERIKDWNGVTFEETRVVLVNLDLNNLQGDFPNITLGLEELFTLSLANNNITSMPALTNMSNLESLDISNNLLAFGSLELNTSILNYVVSPQKNLFEAQDLLLELGSSFSFDGTLSGSSNIYSWLKEPLGGGTAVEFVNSPTLSFEVLDFSIEGNYYLNVTSDVSELSGVTLQSGVFTVKVSSLERDITALQSIYNSANGANWTDVEDFNTMTVDNIATFSPEVVLNNNRVVGIDLSNKNVSGTIPATINDIAGLTTIDLSENLISELPNMTRLNNLTSVNLASNALDFGDLEKNVTLPGLVYSPQANIDGVPPSQRIPQGGNYTIEVITGGNNNEYEWRLTNDVVTDQLLTSANTSTFSITNIDYESMGYFELVITNEQLPQLTLRTDPIEVLATANVSGVITGEGDQPLPRGGIAAFKIEEPNQPFDKVDSVSVTDGVFAIPELVLGDYIFITNSDILNSEGELLYLPTYYESTDLWVEADTLLLRADNQINNYNMAFLPPPPTDGEGRVFGSVEAEFGDEGARLLERRKVKKAGCSVRRFRASGRDITLQDGTFELFAYVETNDNGEFEFSFLPAGLYRFNIEFPGIPMDPNSFVEFEIGGDGFDANNFKLEAFITEGGIEVTRVEALAIYEQYFRALDVYPIPAKDFINIKYDRLLADDVEVRLIDLEGKMISHQKLQTGWNQQYQLDVSEIPDGFYLLHFMDPKEKIIVSYKILIRH
ncbi:MAG: Ig-like domain-containing protein, partial [Cyclobacteriaceae bacterium]